ncbi:MAG: hypothetical protein J6K97_00595 [Clostridia bacterium]|nr:hypothetical protein [Clostridia bacterium]
MGNVRLQAIIDDLKKRSRKGGLDKNETLAALDAALRIYKDIKGEEAEDNFEKVMFSTPAYKAFNVDLETMTEEQYLSTLPTELVGGFDFSGEYYDEKIAKIIMNLVDFADKNDYKGAKIITSHAYSTTMEDYEEQFRSAPAILPMVKQMQGSEGVKKFREVLFAKAKEAIALQRECFYNCVNSTLKTQLDAILQEEREIIC